MRYKVGDVVKIREDLTIGVKYADDYGETWVCEAGMRNAVVMNNYIATIVEARSKGMWTREGYRFDICDRPYFNDGMIEGYALNVDTDDMLNVLGV